MFQIPLSYHIPNVVNYDPAYGFPLVLYKNITNAFEQRFQSTKYII